MRRLSWALLLVPFAAGCVQDDGTRLNPILDRFETSVDEERELGFRFDREAQQQLALVDDLPVLEAIDELGQELVRQVDPQPFVYRFRVIKDSQLNAFAVPGGFVYLHSGTVLGATSVGELAGVMAHEIAHVKARHYARMVQQAAIPNLLTGLAAIAATLATKEPGLGVTAQAVNVALQLRYSREFETEADRLAATFMARAGYDPEGLVRFFERIVLAERAAPVELPPYLYTHPDVEQRISLASSRAEELRPRSPPARDHSESLRRAQARLALLAETDRTAWTSAARFDRSPGDEGLARAEAFVQQGDPESALAALARAAQLEPKDPRVAFRRAQLLAAADRLDEAIAAYRSAIALDPSRALAYYDLGRAHQARGERQQAIFYLEQAARRATPGRGLRERAEWAVEKLSFPLLPEAGLADGVSSEAADTVAGASREEFGPEHRQVAWWGRIGPHFLGHRELLKVRWIDPEGRAALEERPDARRRLYAVSTLQLEQGGGGRAGLWTVEARFDGDLVDRRSFRVLR